MYAKRTEVQTMSEKEERESYPLVDALIDMLDGKTTTEETAERMFKTYMGGDNVGGADND